MTELPFLLRLLDDPSPNVRERVFSRLRALGAGVWDAIEAADLPVSLEQRAQLEAVFAAEDERFSDDRFSDDRALRAQWARLQSESDETTYLEECLLALDRWQNGGAPARRASDLLDDLAGEFLALEPCPDAVALSQFLFEQRGLRGAAPDDYYNPLNSNLTYALENGVGLPITLACIFILVGARVGLEIEGCNTPGHFLARDGRRDTVFDPFNGGRVLSAREVATLRRAAPAEMRGAASARQIIARVLRNLSVAFYNAGAIERSKLVIALLGEQEL